MKIVALMLMSVIISLNAWAERADSKFLDAKKAARQSQWEQFHLLKNEMQDHPLYPYLDYYYINNHFKTIDDGEIEAYIQAYPDSPMAAKLRKKWLYEFAGKDQWDKFIQHYVPDKNMTLICHYITALHETGKKEKAFSYIEKLWLTANTRPDNCMPMFDLWLSASNIKDELIWQRLELALIKKKFALANVLVKKLSPDKKEQAAQILKLYNNPRLLTKKSFLDKKPIAEVMSYGLSRLARISPKEGIKQWQRFRKIYSFTEDQEQRIFQSIGLTMALRKNGESTEWFRKVVGADLPQVYKDWMIRAAIIHNDWMLVIDSIDALKDEERKSLRWQYWYGRALQKIGKIEQSKQVLGLVAKERNYYGFLASYYLKQPIAVKHEALTITPEEITVVVETPGFQRAVLLYELNLKHEARVELFTLMKHLSEKEQYIVTKLISEAGWYTQALRLAHYADHKDDIEVRFPLAYRDEINKDAKKNKVDPALVYAIIRQESYFMPFAKSPAGAIGLMQLMPATAKRTAKQFSLSYSGEKDLINANKSIQLGSAHLKKLKQQLNSHPALVIAAYNAGKNAVNRWIPDKVMPTDVWIETVPYYETRNYLRSVIASYVVYQHRLGVTPSLDSVMHKVKK